MRKLIGLHGLPRSGKDTVARMLAGRYWVRASFADPLKDAAAALLGCDVGLCHGLHGFDREAIMPEWGFSMRWFLQKLGTECMRQQIADDFWIRRMQAQLTKFNNVGVVITDVRFPNEANFVRLNGGVMVEVVRPGTTSNGHISDQHIECDYQIINDGSLEALAAKVEALPAMVARRDA